MILKSNSLDKNILIRTDGDIDIGIGHIKRCIFLALNFKNQGFTPIFLIRYGNKEAKLLIQNNLFPCYFIPEYVDWFLEFEFIHKKTLCSFVGYLFDFSHSKTTFTEKIFPNYFRQWIDSPKCVIDGFMEECLTGKFSLPIDLAVLPYIGYENQKHMTNCHYLMGVNYFCLDPAFNKYLSVRGIVNKNVSNILITSGGNDSKGLSLMAVKAINQLKDEKYNVTVVLGPMTSNKTKKMVELFFNKGRHKYNLVQGLDSLAEKIFFADLVISASGLTKYECAAIGSPTLLISINKEHAIFNRPFEEKGSSRHCGVITQLSTKDLSNEISILIKDHASRQRMSHNGIKLLDGKGIESISKSFLEIISLRGG